MVEEVTEEPLIEHRSRRAAEAVAPRGAASFLTGRFIGRENMTLPDVPGRWSPAPAGTRALVVRARPDEGIRIGGALVDGEELLFADESAGPAVASLPNGAEAVLFSYDGVRFALQIWDPNSPWARSFAGIESWSYDPDWVVDARIDLVETDRVIAVSHHRDPRPVDVPVLAEVRFWKDGLEHTLIGTAGGPDHDGIMLHFRDDTNGTESYGAGRVLQIDTVPGSTRIDFNRAELLPCAFSLAWNCPIPPPENRLPLPLRVGERYAVRQDGEQLL